jgi:hypothetical protein
MKRASGDRFRKAKRWSGLSCAASGMTSAVLLKADAIAVRLRLFWAQRRSGLMKAHGCD